MLRAATLVFFAAAAAGVIGGCSGSQAGCSLSAGDITCQGETFDACAAAGCSTGDFNCSNPPSGCRIAPGMVLERFAEKPPNAFYLCGDPLSMCGSWIEASCQVTITTYSGGSPDAGATTTYAIHDSTCP